MQSSYETTVDGVLIRFTGPYSDYMPHLALTIYRLLGGRSEGSAYVSDLLRAMPPGTFPPRASSYACYQRVARLLVEPVQVGDGVLQLVRETRKSRWQKSTRISFVKGATLASVAPQPYPLVPALASPAMVPASADLAAMITAAVSAAVAKALGHTEPPAEPEPERPREPARRYVKADDKDLPLGDRPLYPSLGAPTRRKVTEKLPNPPRPEEIEAATRQLRPSTYLTREDPRIIPKWQPDGPSPFRGVVDPLGQLQRLKILDGDVCRPHGPEHRPPLWNEMPGLLEGLWWEPLDPEVLRMLAPAPADADG